MYFFNINLPTFKGAGREKKQKKLSNLKMKHSFRVDQNDIFIFFRFAEKPEKAPPWINLILFFF